MKGYRANAWIAAAAGLALVAVAVVVLVVLERRANSNASAAVTRSPQASSHAPSPSSRSPKPTASPSGHATGAPSSYRFNPPVSGSGASPAVQLVAADINGGRQIAARFGVVGPGTVSLHGFGGIGSLSACLEYGQGCTPGAVPNPAFWTLTAEDLAHVGTNFAVRVDLPGGLAGIDVGWNGPHRLTLSNIAMNGSTTGYVAGAGVRYRVATGGTASAASGAGGLFHLKARDKASGAVVPPAGDISFYGSATIPLVPAATWTVYLWSDSSVAASPTFSWP